MKKKALLYRVYHLGLHGNYYQAREILLTNLSYDIISTSKPIIQVYYNRALIQLGLAAFKMGLINETH